MGSPPWPPPPPGRAPPARGLPGPGGYKKKKMGGARAPGSGGPFLMFKMRGLLQASLAVAAAVLFVLGIQADQPTRTPTGTGSKAELKASDLAAKERVLAEKYKEFEQALLILKQRLEKSDRK